MKRNIIAAALLLLAAAVVCFVLLRPGPQPEACRVLVDGRELSSPVLRPELKDDLRVRLTLDGKQIADLPFGEAHLVEILQPGGDQNTLRITGTAVRMESANCEGQDCVHMEEVTRDNLETRVLYGMIVCLPHRLSVEVR